MKCKGSRHTPAMHPKGAATLIVVMVLFLVMALLAAYANRGLMFEQRIAGSYARSALSQEAAEAGIEWTLAQLNGQAIDGNCKPAASGGQRFADKYLQIDPVDRNVTIAKGFAGIFADCTRDLANQGWACRCPDITTRVKPAQMGGGEPTPSFGISGDTISSRGGTISLTSEGCTDSVVDSCRVSANGLGIATRSQNQYAATDFHAMVALVSAVRTPPAAALIVKGDLLMTGAGLGLHNTDPRSASGLLVIGGSWTGMKDDRMEGVPGTALNQLRSQGDPKLSAAATGDDVFKMFMGAAPSRYVQHPALRIVDCNGDCATAIETYYKAGFRMIWVDGPLNFSGNKTLGTLTDPILIVAKGDVTLNDAFVINGMVVTPGNLTWNNAGGVSLINGMVLVGGKMTTNGAMDIVYQQSVANQLMNRIGSFVRVPGSWYDDRLGT